MDDPRARLRRLVPAWLRAPLRRTPALDRRTAPPALDPATLPEGAVAYFRQDHPRLIELRAVLERFGYHVTVCEPRYSVPIVQQYGIDPVHLQLFELR